MISTLDSNILRFLSADNVIKLLITEHNFYLDYGYYYKYAYLISIFYENLINTTITSLKK